VQLTPDQRAFIEARIADLEATITAYIVDSNKRVAMMQGGVAELRLQLEEAEKPAVEPAEEPATN
jgi:hypothetical protein